MTRLQPLLRALSLALLVSSTIVPGATAQQQGPYCAPCQNSNFVAYNRCSYWSIDDLTLDCGAIPCQSRFRLDSSTKKASIRFTISPALTGNQTIRSVWLYYRTVGTWTGPAYVLNVCSDANGVPGAVLNSSPFQPRVPGASGWQQVDLTSPVGGLVPGS